MCLPCGEVENATVVIVVGRWSLVYVLQQLIATKWFTIQKEKWTGFLIASEPVFSPRWALATSFERCRTRLRREHTA